jgi:cytosine/adenosine deaminase-related metal-dependent hydrolase
VERVKFGVTTGVSILGATPARCDDSVFAERHAEAVGAVGLRDFVGVGPTDPFLTPTPWSGTFFEGDRAIERPFTYEQTIEVAQRVIKGLKGKANGRLQALFAMPYLCGLNPAHMKCHHRYDYTEEEARTMRDKAVEARGIADELDVRIHTHGARGVFEWAERHYGAELVREVLGPDVIFAHANGLTNRDISIMQEVGCAAAAVPFASWNTYLGTCPIVKLIRRGVRVAIATDGAAPFHISDLFIDLHRAMFLQWMENRDMSLLPAGRAIRLITVEAATLLGMGHEIGSLEVGKKADINLIDLDQPHLVPCEDLPNMIAYYVRGNDVDAVIVDGVVLMEGREVTTVDEATVLEYAREEARRSFERIDVSPYLDHGSGFWQGWREAITQNQRASTVERGQS